MKLAPILAQFLYANKRLDLPGIGSFLLDPDLAVDPESLKTGKSSLAGGISFESNTSIRESPELVSYITRETGKMKALASADLDSFVQQVQQFINIGKPFLLEGIGSLVKIQSGEYVYVPGELLHNKIKEYTAREINATSSTEDSFTGYKNIFFNDKAAFKWKRHAAWILLLAGIAFTIWGSYTVYKKTTAKNKTHVNPEINKEPKVTADSTGTIVKDTMTLQQPVAGTGMYKFILEIAKSQRAFDRYAKLKSYQWDIKMETKDSVEYKLYMFLHAAAADTARILDSLTALNGRRVYIEN